MRRGVGVGLAAALALGVVLTVVLGTGALRSSGSSSTVTVRGVIGSEKAPLFADPRVQKILADNGYRVEIDTAGSRQIATTALAQKPYDFAFPSSAPAAVKISNEQKPIATYDPFYSPMIVATFRPIADLLTSEGVVQKRPDGTLALDVAAYLQLVKDKKRWTELTGNTSGSVYPSKRQVLVTSTDVRTSNSAAMYLAIASYVANGNEVVSTPAAEAAVAPVLEQLFLGQGFSEASSEGPFTDYLTQGIGKAPLVLAYESQFLSRQVAKDPALTDQMTLLYPSPTVLSQHRLLAFTPGGDAVSKLITTDPGLQRLVAEYGFRTPDRAVFASVLQEKGVAVPPEIVDTVDTPAYEVQEAMIVNLEQQYQAQGAPGPSTSPSASDAG